MARFLIWVVSISVILLQAVSSADEEVKQSLLIFFQQLSNGKHPNDPNFGWNGSSDPCSGLWSGVLCDRNSSVRSIILESLGFDGILNADAICAVQSLRFLSIENNNIQGVFSDSIANCKQLTRLYINDNRFEGSIPISLSDLNNLKRLDVSNNMFTGALPDLSKISSLLGFSGQINGFSGKIPQFNFLNLVQFNVSFNYLSGPIPDAASHFDASSFMGNSGLCGKPLHECSSPAPAPAVYD